MTNGEDWLIVEAKRDDGTPTMFRIRELAPKRQLTKIFVVELPYPKLELSKLPTASDYHRLGEFEEQWLRPACASLGWELVGYKAEDGSFFLYMYGSSDPDAMVAKLSPFDAGLGFYQDDDPDWQEYGTLRDLLDQARAIPLPQPAGPALTAPAKLKAKAKAKAKATAKAKPRANARATPRRAAAQPAQAAKRKPKPAAKRTPRSKPTAAKRKRG